MKLIRLLTIVCLLSLTIFSCKKEDEVMTNKINAKWEVTSTNSLYQSFEFTKSGTFLIVKTTETKSTASDNYTFGSYDMADKTLTLEDFGTIEINALTNSQVSFTLKLSTASSETIEILAKKAEEMSGDTKTNLLCKTWQLDKINGKPVLGTSDELTVLFSRAGTYFVQFENPDIDHENGLALWKWNNSEQTHIFYSWTDTLYDDPECKIEISEITASSLKMTEYTEFEDIGENYFRTYELSPIENNKSATINSNINIEHSFHNQSGLFNRPRE